MGCAICAEQGHTKEILFTIKLVYETISALIKRVRRCSVAWLTQKQKRSSVIGGAKPGVSSVMVTGGY